MACMMRLHSEKVLKLRFYWENEGACILSYIISFVFSSIKTEKCLRIHISKIEVIIKQLTFS